MPLPRAAILRAAACTCIATACGTFGRLESSTLIDPGMTFLLGGGHSASFRIAGRNAGPVPVVIYAERGGRRDTVTTVEPGGRVDAEFPTQTVAVFRNTSRARQAVMQFDATGAISGLGMRYETNMR